MAKRMGANRRKKMAQKRVRKGVNQATARTLVGIVLVGVLGVSAALGARKAMDWAEGAETLAIRQVTVKGSRRVDSTQVLEMAAIAPGSSLIKLKAGEVKKRLRDNVWVAGTRVQRLFPGTVVITLTERRPVALANLGRVHMVDKEGVLLPLIPGECIDQPMLSGLRDSTGDDGLHRLTSESTKRMAAALEELRSSKTAVAARVCQVNFGNDRTLSIKLEGSHLVVELNETELGGDLERLQRVVRAANARNSVPRHIDLCYSSFAYVR